MVRIVLCDRCEDRIESDDTFDKIRQGEDYDFWEGILDAEMTSGVEVSRLKRPHLCKNCRPFYNELIMKFNDEIDDFLRKGKIIQTANKPKSKSFFRR